MPLKESGLIASVVAWIFSAQTINRAVCNTASLTMDNLLWSLLHSSSI
jgi:hypothetical protein